MPKILTAPAHKPKPKNATRAQQLRYTGNELRRHRINAGLSVKALAAKARVSVNKIYHCENADGFISLEAYQAICDALGLPQPLLS